MAAAASREESLEALFSAMSVASLQIGSQFYAIPTHLIDPHNFYVMPYSHVYQRSALNKIGEQLRVDELQENTIVIYRSKHPDLKLYFGERKFDSGIRGRIEKINGNNKCSIFALDHGFTEEEVHVDSMWHPYHQEVLDMPPLIYHCELDMCEPIDGSFADNAIDAFKFFMGNEKIKICIHGKTADKLKVKVYNSNPDDVSTLLALTHYTRLANIQQVMTVQCSNIPKLKYQHMKLDVGQSLLVRVQSGSSLENFYVCPMAAYSKYVQERKDFTNYCKSLPAITPNEFRRSTLVGVEYDFHYERAIILAVNELNATTRVKLVDWGTEIVVSKNAVKTIKTEKYTMSPANAIYCAAIEGFEAWETGLPTFLYKGYCFNITVNQVGKEFTTPNIVTLSKEK